MFRLNSENDRDISCMLLRAELARILVSEQTKRPMGDFLKYIDQWETSENVDSKLAP